MVVVKWVDQTADKGGLLLAVDGQPDTSIGRKRFWEGTFLFNNDVKSAGPGFKAFRPLARGADGKLEPLANAAIGRQGRRRARAVLRRAEEGVVGRPSTRAWGSSSTRRGWTRRRRTARRWTRWSSS